MAISNLGILTASTTIAATAGFSRGLFFLPNKFPNNKNNGNGNRYINQYVLYNGVHVTLF